MLNRLALTVAGLGMIVSMSGCTIDPSIRERIRETRLRNFLPPPPSEEMRSELGTVRVSEVPTDIKAVFTGPAMGASQGASRGAAMGSAGLIAFAAEGGPLGGLLVVFLPVAALVGAVAGAANAEPAATVDEKATLLKGALEDLKVPEAVRGCVDDALAQRTSPLGAVVSSDDGASTILEVVVEKFGLATPWGINRPGSFVMTERTRLIRSSDGTEIYKHWLTYRGPARPFDDWVAQSPTTLREEAARACRELAERLVDEVFLLYLTGADLRRGRR